MRKKYGVLISIFHSYQPLKGIRHRSAVLKEGFSWIVSLRQLIRSISGFQDGPYDHLINNEALIFFTGIFEEVAMLKFFRYEIPNTLSSDLSNRPIISFTVLNLSFFRTTRLLFNNVLSAILIIDSAISL